MQYLSGGINTFQLSDSDFNSNAFLSPELALTPPAIAISVIPDSETASYNLDINIEIIVD